MKPIDLVLLLVMAAAFWLLILRPAKVRREAQAKLVAALAPGKRVMTAGGIFGTVVAVEPDRVRLEVAPGMVLEMLPQAIAEVVAPVEQVSLEQVSVEQVSVEPASVEPASVEPASEGIDKPEPTARDGREQLGPRGAGAAEASADLAADPDAPAGAPTSGEADRG